MGVLLNNGNGGIIENLSAMTQAEIMFMDKVMYESCIHVTFSHVPRLPSSLSVSHVSPEVLETWGGKEDMTPLTGDQLKCTLNKIT